MMLGLTRRRLLATASATALAGGVAWSAHAHCAEESGEQRAPDFRRRPTGGVGGGVPHEERPKVGGGVPVGPAAILSVSSLVLLGAFGVFAGTRYKRVPPNKVLVIFGKTGATGKATSRCVHGGGAFVWPVVQSSSWLSLEPMQIDIPLKGALAKEDIRVNLPAVFTVAIGTTPQLMEAAAVRLLDLSRQDIAHQAGEIIYGQLREVIATMEIHEINSDREKFMDKVSKSLSDPLQKYGLELINVNIRDVTDDQKLIENKGRKAATRASEEARVDVAERMKVGAVGEAQQLKEREIQVAIATAARELGIKEAQQKQAIRVASLQKEQEVLVKQAAFEQAAAISAREQEMRVAIAKANADAVSGENESRAKIQESNAILAVKTAEAFEQGETKRRVAEASVAEAESRARAKAAVAEGERVEAVRRAELVAPAIAAKQQLIVEAEAAAAKTKLEADASAHRRYAELEATARGEFEVMAKKAEGMRKFIEACGGSERAFQLLMLEHIDHLADTSAKAISNIKFDKVVVWDGAGNGGGGSNTANFIQSIAQALPPALSIMKDVGGIKMPAAFGEVLDAQPKTTTTTVTTKE